jgi:hypothetical protein
LVILLGSLTGEVNSTTSLSVGWRDRDWARFDESERRVLYGSKALRGSTNREYGLRLLAVGVAAVAATGVALGQFPRHHPVVPAFAFNLPHIGGSRFVASQVGRGQTIVLGGPSVVSRGGTYTFRGRTGGVNTVRITGGVVARGRWNGGAWKVLARTKTDARGSYTLALKLTRLGVVDIRISTPDGYISTKTVRVT